jgi:polyphosphate kinase
MKRKERLPFFNRELSWIEFNARVLGEALDVSVPVLERLKFLCIVDSNFDEFFMIRVASLKRFVKTGNYVTCPSGMSPRDQLTAISKRVKELERERNRCLLDEVLPEMAKHGIRMLAPSECGEEQAEFMQARFERDIFPVLTPVRIDRSKPFTLAGNLRLHVAFILRPQSGVSTNDEPEGDRMAIVQIPSSMERVIRLPSKAKNLDFCLLEDVIIEYAAKLFPGYDLTEHLLFRLTRDADLGVDEERDDDFVEALTEVLENRRTSEAVRLSLNGTSKRLKTTLTELLGLQDEDVYELPGPVDLRSFMGLVDLPGFDHLRGEMETRQMPRPRRRRVDLVRAFSQGHSPAFPLRVIQPTDPYIERGRRRSGRVGHQDDAVPNQR